MQQSSATLKKQDVGRGLRKIVAHSQPYLAVPSCIYSFWHSVIPTSYFDFYTCNIYDIAAMVVTSFIWYTYLALSLIASVNSGGH